MPSSNSPSPSLTPPVHPFRRAVLRGMGVVLPPLLTIVIFVWVGNTVAIYLLEPLETAATRALVIAEADIRNSVPDYDPVEQTGVIDGKVYRKTVNEKFVPLEVFEFVRDNLGAEPMPTTATGIYRRYVQIRYLQWYVVLPVFLFGFILILYLLGKFLAAGVGRFFWNLFERIIHALPLIRNVYSSVKQVTDFMFNEHQLEYTRIVAVEYPRKGTWSLAFVTGEGMLDIRSAANEPVLSVLIPTSPAPFTGFAVIVKKSETVDLNLTMDQALQFLVSCGVVIPPHQMWQLREKQEEEERQRALASENGDSSLRN